MSTASEGTTSPRELERELGAADIATALGVASVQDFDVLDSHPEHQKYPLITARTTDTYVAVASAETNPLEESAEFIQDAQLADVGGRTAIIAVTTNDSGDELSQIVWHQRGRYFNIAHIGPAAAAEGLAIAMMGRVDTL